MKVFSGSKLNPINIFTPHYNKPITAGFNFFSASEVHRAVCISWANSIVYMNSQRTQRHEKFLSNILQVPSSDKMPIDVTCCQICNFCKCLHFRRTIKNMIHPNIFMPSMPVSPNIISLILKFKAITKVK